MDWPAAFFLSLKILNSERQIIRKTGFNFEEFHVCFSILIVDLKKLKPLKVIDFSGIRISFSQDKKKGNLKSCFPIPMDEIHLTAIQAINYFYDFDYLHMCFINSLLKKYAKKKKRKIKNYFFVVHISKNKLVHSGNWYYAVLK